MCPLLGPKGCQSKLVIGTMDRACIHRLEGNVHQSEGPHARQSQVSKDEATQGLGVRFPRAIILNCEEFENSKLEPKLPVH